MTCAEKAVEWAISVANDPSHGYDQANRWGPDYDCSSLVISAYKQAGVPLTCTYTGNMRSDMLNNGFAPVANANKQTGANLLPGDVLLNETHHTAMYIGNGKIVQASINEMGGVTGGKTGDQANEINIHSYYNFPWDCILRYAKKVEPKEETKDGWYVVKSGDTLWGIAEKFLGAGERYIQIMSANNLMDSMIHPGQRLVIPTEDTTYKTIQITITQDTYTLLSIMAEGWNKTIGQCIDALMEDAV